MDIKSFARGIAVGAIAPSAIENKEAYIFYMETILPEYGVSISDVAEIVSDELEILEKHLANLTAELETKDVMQ